MAASEIPAPPKPRGREQQDARPAGSSSPGLLARPSSSCALLNASFLLRFAYIYEEGS